MKFRFPPSVNFLWLALALVLAPAAGLRADDTSAPAAEKKAAADATPADQAGATAAYAPAKPEDKRAATAPSADEPKTAPEKSESAEKPEKTEPARPLRELGNAGGSGKRSRGHHGSSQDRVNFGGDSTLGADEEADSVVAIVGTATSAGEVHQEIVSVLGSTRVTGGVVHQGAVAVLGSAHIDGQVKQEVVAVLGDIDLGPNAEVDGDVVCIGGDIHRDDKAVVHGNVQSIAIGQHLAHFEWLSEWISRCLLWGRPLAFGPHLAWAWMIALMFVAFYTLIALIAPGAVNRCVDTLEQRPGYSILAAILTMLLTPVVFVLLTLTIAIIIGIPLIPIFSLGLLCVKLFGRVVILAFFGRHLRALVGGDRSAHPALSVILGGALTMLIYTIPVVGFLAQFVIGFLGLGAVVYTLVGTLKQEREAKAAAAAAAQGAAAARAAAASAQAAAVAATAAATASVTATEVPPVVGAPGPEGAAPPPLAPPPVAPPLVPKLPPVISAATLPRAGFWIRFLASLLDFVLVAFASHLLHLGSATLLLFSVYCVAMWVIKGTTIGGAVCGLKVVRLDDRPIDWSIAIVRGLGGFLSLAIMGLGFMWVALDDERQSWHDKIAGTTIVHVPKGTSLV